MEVSLFIIRFLKKLAAQQAASLHIKNQQELLTQ
jgi:hypothetical protein